MLSNHLPEPITWMTSPTQNNTDLLSYRGSTSLPIIRTKESKTQFPFGKDHFYEEADKLPLALLLHLRAQTRGQPPVPDYIWWPSRGRLHSYKLSINSEDAIHEVRATMRELEVRIQDPVQSALFDAWWQKVLALLRVTNKLNQARVKKP